jgi:hypothetical protein
MNRPGKGRSRTVSSGAKNSGKSNSAKQLLFQLDADELKKNWFYKNSTSKEAGQSQFQM